MNIDKRLLRQFAVIGISASGIISPLGAQQSRLAPVEVGQIADVVLATVLPPTDSLSRIPIAKRRIFLDFGRTLAAFGHGATVSPADLHIRRAVIPGSKRLLDDCDPFGEKPCKQLGWGAYVWIEPVSVTTSHAVVRIYVVWADRGTSTFRDGVEPIAKKRTEKPELVSFASNVELARGADGRWKFVQRGSTAVSE